MTLVNALPRPGGTPVLHSYTCKSCDVEFTELDTGDAPLPERVCVLNFEAGQVSLRQ